MQFPNFMGNQSIGSTKIFLPEKFRRSKLHWLQAMGQCINIQLGLEEHSDREAQVAQ